MGSLVCWDSREPGGQDLFECELSWLVWKATENKNVEMVVIVDSCHLDSLKTLCKLLMLWQLDS